MSEAKFTKGEWLILPLEDDKEYIRIRGTVLGGRYKIANVTDLKFHHDGKEWCKRERGESLANANLIAAAPDMYELLDEVSHVLGHELNPTSKTYIKAIKELLAKARGEKC